jgi:DNA-binding MarR family transcriptional regulator
LRRNGPSDDRQGRKKKVEQAWAAYLEFSETAAWIEGLLWGPLDVFGLTREEFRLMLMLYRDGTLTVTEAAKKLGRFRQGVDATIRRTEQFGWIRRRESRLAPAEIRENRLPKARRGRPRQGVKVSRISLTPQGERLIGNVLPKQQSVVRSLMIELNGRELDTLMTICRKLRGSVLLPFQLQLVKQHVAFDESPEAELMPGEE